MDGRAPLHLPCRPTMETRRISISGGSKIGSLTQLSVYSKSAERGAIWMPEQQDIENEKARRRYRRNPTAYAREVLKVHWWGKQVEVAVALLKHKRVFVKASHSVGKSFLAGGLVNWFFDSFDPGICITTAPNAPQVRDILWKEVRVQRPAHLRGVLQPKAPRMETGPDHFAVGYTARDDSGFQGRHEEFVFIVFDECVGVESPFWDAAEGMMTGTTCYWLAICNPTDTGSRAYIECRNTQKWHVIEISALEHPNIAAELAGERVLFPKAVRLDWVNGRITEWCTELYPQISQISQINAEGTSPPGPPLPVRFAGEGELRAGDFEFPVGSGRWYRPGPLFESRVLGRWPTQGATSVWSEAMWQSVLARQTLDAGERLAIGCDVARFGDDFTSIVVRRGSCVLHHETHNGWSTTQTVGRLKQLAGEFAQSGIRPEGALITIDDDGVGGGVTDQAGDFQFMAVKGGSKAVEPRAYPNRRSELWFATADRASEGRLDLSRLRTDSRQLIQRQVMAPTWRLDSQGRRVVEAKAETKKRIGRSPDDADALNLAFAAVATLQSDTAMHARFWQMERE